MFVQRIVNRCQKTKDSTLRCLLIGLVLGLTVVFSPTSYSDELLVFSSFTSKENAQVALNKAQLVLEESLSSAKVGLSLFKKNDEDYLRLVIYSFENSGLATENNTEILTQNGYPKPWRATGDILMGPKGLLDVAPPRAINYRRRSGATLTCVLCGSE